MRNKRVRKVTVKVMKKNLVMKSNSENQRVKEYTANTNNDESSEKQKEQKEYRVKKVHCKQ